MKNIRSNLHAKVHRWMDSIGFSLNTSQTDKKRNVTTNHYFFETFNFIEKAKNNDVDRSQFLCFDMYGETINVKSLLDLQPVIVKNFQQNTAVISRLK